MSFLDEMLAKDAKSVENRKPFMAFYSDVGMGKTSLLSRFKDSAIIYGPGEPGIKDLKMNQEIPADYPAFEAQSFDDLLKITDELIESGKERGIHTVGYDSVTEFCRLLMEEVTMKQFEGSRKAFDSFGNGLAACVPLWDKFLIKLTQLQEAGIMPVVVGHEKVVSVMDPVVGEYASHTIDLPENKTTSLLRPLLQRVTELGFIHTISEKSTDKDTKGKTVGGTSRRISFTPKGAYKAKTRVGIGTVAMGNSADEAYKNLMTAYKSALDKKKGN